jgi:hypothetical protein
LHPAVRAADVLSPEPGVPRWTERKEAGLEPKHSTRMHREAERGIEDG